MPSALLIESGISLIGSPFLQRMAEMIVEDKDMFQCSSSIRRENAWPTAIREGGVPDSNLIYYLTQPVLSKDGHVIGSLDIGLSLRKLNREMEVLKTETFFSDHGGDWGRDSADPHPYADSVQAHRNW